MTVELILAGVAVVAAIIAAIFSLLRFLQGRKSREASDFELLTQLLRTETDSLKRSGEDQARGLR